MKAEAKIKRALDYAILYGTIDGSHHKMWVIDQMVRALTGCPIVIETAYDGRNEKYSYAVQGESEEYRAFCACEGEYQSDWNEGIAP